MWAGERSVEMKKKLGGRNALYPTPVTLIGALVDGRPNYITIAYVGIIDHTHVSISMGKVHYTNDGIRSSGTFSVNIAPERLVKETDYCGLVSGRKVDKAALFDTFYGELETAPMIEQCPVNMECRLASTVDMPKHDVFIGEVVQVYCDEECASGDNIDFSVVRPVLFAMYDSSYFRLGERFAQAWSVGKELIR
jgi:flavin reductase (DIM6/NTAB) family NADH-FMN oxidoreductase RutF